jgi:cyclic beta-1,2-glucan synthetase
MNIARPSSVKLEEPIRAELFGVERLEQHAESLAAAQVVTADPRQGRGFIPRVLDNGRVLVESYRTITRAMQEEHAITPAAEWLVDNFHIVEEQVREIIDDLPPSYYRQLPKLASGHYRTIRGSSGSLGHSLHTQTVASIPTCCAAFWRRISGCSL